MAEFILNKNYVKRKIIFLALFSLCTNLLLGLTKWFLGYHFHILSLRAEAWNNLTDAFSQFLILACLYISQKPADKEHPYGHARLEYLSSIGLAIFLAVVAGQIIFQGINNWNDILLPHYHFLNIAILITSIIIKTLFIWLYYYYGKKIESPSLMASTLDSFFDVLSSIFIILSLTVLHFTGFNLDKYLSLLLAVFMIYTAYSLLKEMIDALLGQSISLEEQEAIIKFILEQEGVIGCHDLMAHRYGPKNVYITCHIEVDAKLTLAEAHEISDKIEQHFWQTKRMPVLTHLDPTYKLDKYEAEIKDAISDYWQSIHPLCWLHDFRIKKDERKRNKRLIYFELMFPYEVNLKEKEWRRKFEAWFFKHYPYENLDYLIELGDISSYEQQNFVD